MKNQNIKTNNEDKALKTPRVKVPKEKITPSAWRFLTGCLALLIILVLFPIYGMYSEIKQAPAKTANMLSIANTFKSDPTWVTSSGSQQKVEHWLTCPEMGRECGRVTQSWATDKWITNEELADLIAPFGEDVKIYETCKDLDDTPNGYGSAASCFAGGTVDGWGVLIEASANYNHSRDTLGGDTEKYPYEVRLTVGIPDKQLW